MMTLEEVWENLRQDPETKATMEEVDKSYKLFKKIENLIVADLEAKLAESEKKADEFHDKLLDEMQNRVDREVELTNCLNNVVDERDQLKQQLAEKEKEVKGYSALMDNYIYQIDTLKKCGDADHFYLLLEEKRNENEILSKAYKQLEQSQNQTAIAILEEVLDNEVYINSKLDFEDGNYVLSKIIRAKIKSLKGETND